MQQIAVENRMVIDSKWQGIEVLQMRVSGEFLEQERKSLNGSGYSEIWTGTFVPEEEAFDYALKRCLHGTEEDKKEFRAMLVEWFYSGNWIKED